ncbi:MAG: signal peptidase I [Candidatus Aenigmarchaeota archaeon]|nr:signal peptidase I [Candidatus Aenigmarchaeota archaeon]
MTKEKKSLYKDVLEIIAAFLVAWLFYQGLAFVTGTALPIVSVVSDSMVHMKAFDEWWNGNKGFYETRNITKEKFAFFQFSNGLSRGDLLFVLNAEPEVGDVAIYQRTKTSITIVHRVVEKNPDGYIFKGDNNPGADPPVGKEQIVGKVLFAAPLLGYPRLALYAIGI